MVFKYKVTRINNKYKKKKKNTNKKCNVCIINEKSVIDDFERCVAAFACKMKTWELAGANGDTCCSIRRSAQNGENK